MKDVLAPYPNTLYRDRFERETEKRLADLAIANAQQAVVASSEIVATIADVNAVAVPLQADINPDYKAKLDQEAAVENPSEHETNVDSSGQIPQDE